MLIPHHILYLMNQNLRMMKFDTQHAKVRNAGRGAGEIVRKVMSLVERLLFLRTYWNTHRDGFYGLQVTQDSARERNSLRLFSLGVKSCEVVAKDIGGY